MPIHDWTRVSEGEFHDFHNAWVVALRTALNSGLLPPDYYALGEQIAGGMGPDVITLHDGGAPTPSEGDTGGVAVAAPPTVLLAPPLPLTAQSEAFEYARKRRTVVVRHVSEHRVVALIEVLSPGNKAGRHALRAFLDKAVQALTCKIHLLLIDLFPPSPRDPQGIHGALWEEISDAPYTHPPDRPLTLAAYSAGEQVKAYVVPARVGESLVDMPLFLEPEGCVPLTLEAAYVEAFRGVPRQVKRSLGISG